VKTAYRLIALTALTAGTQAQPPFRVGGLALDSPARLSGDCGKSTRVHFSGRINATGAGDVTYQWVRSDNANTPVKTLHFSHSGPLPVSDDWNIKGFATGWEAIRVLSPNQVESNKVSFRINCRY
jgi:hypothetical protein